ncbi:putative Nuclear hormone receptor family member nhr-49 [Hypsibius exemplaris]|uniref:Nuclear hormone receptor family member nhr-49 n=1 Tax=Hypsibius exemplaris TaxID=2072580 RepID=A0A9X6NL46_HYPEX|nr:putative Nuclear hormone receptor family member nhr-49 [Hypsibius exemplaris]
MKCEICGRAATGVHYGVLACEGCKAFYRRGVEKKITYLCYFGNNCTPDANTRACCKACRFQRCLRLGMKIHGAKLKDPVLDGKKKGKRKLQGKNAESPESCPTMEISRITCSTQTDPNPLSTNPGISSADDFIDPDDALFPDLALAEVPSGYELDLADMDVEDDEAAASVPSDRLAMVRSKREGQPPRRKMVTFMNHYMAVLEDNRRQMAATVQAVASAIEEVFGDQIRCWKSCMERELIFGEMLYQPQTTLEIMMETLYCHNADSVKRTQRFASMMPGTCELDVSAKKNVTAGWKWLAFWLIHHGGFLTAEESYIVIGADNLRYCRYWQQMISEWPLLVFIYKFCGEFKEIGLTQIETYLLLAVVMFEPGVDVRKQSPEGNSKLELIHRHYTDVLFDALKRRCTDNAQLTDTCRKLERFFSALKLVHRLHRHYFRALDMTKAPFRAMKGQRQVTVLDALRWKDDNEDPNGFDNRAPLAYKPFAIRIGSSES